MRRRRYLAVLGTGLSAAVAGCGDGSSTETPTPAPTPTREGLVAEYRAQLTDRDIDVQTIEWDGGTLRLEYYSDAGSRSGFVEEVQKVAAAVASAYGQYLSLGIDRFEMTADAYNDDVLAAFHVQPGWVERLMKREMTERAFLRRVRDTIEYA
jgi:hypothetical protein